MMIQGTLISSSPIDVNGDVIETALRRQINAELINIKEKIHQFGRLDELSQLIAQWHQNFSAAMRLNTDVKKLLNSYVSLMQEILRDPINQAPLDHQPCLGSDGKTYSGLFLQLYLNDESNQYKNRSPLDPLNSALFTACSHDLASYMNQWLQQHNAFLYTEEMERNAQRCLNERIKSEPSKGSSQLLRERVKKIQEEREKKINKEKEDFEKEIEEVAKKFKQWVEEDLKVIQTRAKEIEEKSIQNIKTIRQLDQQQLSALSNQIEILDQEISKIENQVQDLKQTIENVKDEISEAQKDRVQLEILTNEVKVALKKRDRSNVTNFLGKAALIIGSCAFSTWALQGISGGGAIIPLPNGFGLKLTIAL